MANKNKARGKAEGTPPSASPPKETPVKTEVDRSAVNDVVASPQGGKRGYVRNLSNRDAEHTVFIDDFLGQPLQFCGGVAVIKDCSDYGGVSIVSRVINEYSIEELSFSLTDPR